MVFIISPETLYLFWHLKLILSHNLLAKLHESTRCCIVSSRWLQLGHIECLWKLFFLRLSQVSILFWHSSQRNVDTLGQIMGDQILSQRGSLGSWFLIKRLYASLVVKIPWGVYPHLRISFLSEYLIFRFISYVSISLWNCSVPWLVICAAFNHCLYPWFRMGAHCWLNFFFCCMPHSSIYGGLKMFLNFGLRCHESANKQVVLPSLISQKMCC